MSARTREKEIIDILAGSNSPDMQRFKELLELRLERYKDDLVSRECGMKRGMAQEVKDLLKKLDRTI